MENKHRAVKERRRIQVSGLDLDDPHFEQKFLSAWSQENGNGWVIDAIDIMTDTVILVRNSPLNPAIVSETEPPVASLRESPNSIAPMFHRKNLVSPGKSRKTSIWVWVLGIIFGLIIGIGAVSAASEVAAQYLLLIPALALLLIPFISQEWESPWSRHLPNLIPLIFFGSFFLLGSIFMLDEGIGWGFILLLVPIALAMLWFHFSKKQMIVDGSWKSRKESDTRSVERYVNDH